MNKQEANLNVPCAGTHDHIYEGHKSIKNCDYVDTSSETKSLYKGLDPTRAGHMSIERRPKHSTNILIIGDGKLLACELISIK